MEFLRESSFKHRQKLGKTCYWKDQVWSQVYMGGHMASYAKPVLRLVIFIGNFYFPRLYF